MAGLFLRDLYHIFHSSPSEPWTCTNCTVRVVESRLRGRAVRRTSQDLIVWDVFVLCCLVHLLRLSNDLLLSGQSPCAPSTNLLLAVPNISGDEHLRSQRLAGISACKLLMLIELLLGTLAVFSPANSVRLAKHGQGPNRWLRFFQEDDEPCSRAPKNDA